MDFGNTVSLRLLKCFIIMTTLALINLFSLVQLSFICNTLLFCSGAQHLPVANMWLTTMGNHRLFQALLPEGIYQSNICVYLLIWSLLLFLLRGQLVSVLTTFADYAKGYVFLLLRSLTQPLRKHLSINR